MILVVGLGNPGIKFQNTRHNLGFTMVNQLQKECGFSAWQNKTKLKAKISQGLINNEKIILAKPQTFMNQSGEAVKLLTDFYKIPLENLWIVQDDIDLKLGQLKIIQNRGTAGHKGVQSIIDCLGSKNFTRFRMGIKPDFLFKKINKKKFALQKFSPQEQKILNLAKSNFSAAAILALKEGIQTSMSQFNKKEF